MSKKLLALCFVLLLKVTIAQTTYTWNGTTSNSWNVNTNWTPNGVPTSVDNVLIVAGSNTCHVVASRAINNFTLTNGTLDLGTFTFTVNGNTIANTGTILGTASTIDCEGSTTVFGSAVSGPLVHASVIINALTVTLQRTVFNNSVRVTKLYGGSSIDKWRGGNTFNGEFYLDNASYSTADNVGDIYLGTNSGDPVDVFNGRSTFYVTGCGRIRVPQNGTAVFNGVTSFYSNGYGVIHDRIQPARMGNATITFNDSTYFYCNSTTTDMQIAYEKNTQAIFNGPVIATHYGPSAAVFSFGLDGTVNFNDNVFLNCLGTGAITITNGIGNSTLAVGKTISVGSIGFSSGRLSIQNFTQLGSTAQALALTGTAGLGIGASGKSCTYNADINFTAPTLALINSTFNGAMHVITKTGASSDQSGANTFNGAVILTNSSPSDFNFSGTVSGDVFNSTLDIYNTGTGLTRLSRLYDATYADNITVSNSIGSGITFGTSGGTSTLANGKTIAVGTGGYAKGYLYLYKFNQASATPQNINLAGVNTLLRMGDQANITTGCNFTGNFTGSAQGIELTGNSFAGVTIFNQNGLGAASRLWGGNTFIGPHTINVSGSYGIQCSQLIAHESYSSSVNVNLTSSGGVTLARTFNTIFPENITLTSTSLGAVAFGFAGGYSTLNNGKTISIGPAGYTGSLLYLYRFNQVGSTPQSLTITGASSSILIGALTPSTYGCTFDGNLNVTAPNIQIISSTFSGTTTFIKTGAGTDDNNNGNNTFHGPLDFSNNCTTSSVFVRMSVLFGPDTYNGPVTLSSSCTNGGFVMARTYNGIFNDNITCNSTSNGFIYMGFGTTYTGIATLAASKTIRCGTFSAGTLSLRRFTQIGFTSQSITTTGSGNIEFGALSTTAVANSFAKFDGDLTANASGTGYIAINSSLFDRDAFFTATYYPNFIRNTFNQTVGNTFISRMGGTTNDDIGGGNTVNGNFTLNNTGSGRFRTGVTAYGGDAFNSNFTLINSGTATISIAANNGTNTIGGNLDITNTASGTTIFGESATSNNTTLAGIINVSSGNFTSGTINIRFLTQLLGNNTIIGTASAAAFAATSCLVNGAFNMSNVGSSTILNSTFNDNTTLNNTNTTVIRNSNFNAINNFTATAFVLGGTLAQGNTFTTGNTNFTKTGTSNDDINGGNVFNASTTFVTTNGTGRWRLGVTSVDDFNGDVAFSQEGLGILSPNYDGGSTYAGNITVSAITGSAITFGSGTGRAIMDGLSSQSISKINGNDPNFTRLTLNKSANDITLNTRVNIINDLTLTQGICNTTATNILNMNNGSATTIGNASSYINGPMNYDMALSGSRTLNFPIGKSTDWRPATLIAAHNNVTSYTYNAELTNASANALGWTQPTTINLTSLTHYWDIERIATTTRIASPSTHLAGTQAITLYYGVNDGVTDPTFLTVVKNTSAAPTTWFDIGGTGATAGSGSVKSSSSPTIFNSYSRFTLANKLTGINPLPIELLYFTVKPVEKMARLEWATASESNNNHFEIERSIDGINFEYLTSVKAYGDGNSITKQIYKSVDAKPYKGVSYYRLKQVDNNNTFKYAQIVSVEFVSDSYINIFPSPASNVMMINASDDYNNAFIKIISNLGVEVLTNTKLNFYNGTIDLSNLASGIYYVMIEKGDNSESIKITIQK